jgi:hypothetical protein
VTITAHEPAGAANPHTRLHMTLRRLRKRQVQYTKRGVWHYRTQIVWGKFPATRFVVTLPGERRLKQRASAGSTYLG